MATIYKILSPCLKECYVGSTTQCVEKRWKHHRDKWNKCQSKVLFEKYGVENCQFTIVEQCSTDERLIREQWHIDNSEGVVNLKSAFVTEEEKEAWMIAWKESHCEELKEKAKARYQEKRDELLIMAREYRAEHGEAINIRRRELRDETTLTRERAWQAANREKLNAQARARRAAKKSE